MQPIWKVAVLLIALEVPLEKKYFYYPPNPRATFSGNPPQFANLGSLLSLGAFLGS
jgi:hypothetical protein